MTEKTEIGKLEITERAVLQQIRDASYEYATVTDVMAMLISEGADLATITEYEARLTEKKRAYHAACRTVRDLVKAQYPTANVYEIDVETGEVTAYAK